MAERLLSVRLRAIVDGYEKAMGKAAAATDKVTTAGRKLEKNGKAVTAGFSVPVAAAGAFSLKAAVDFESAFTGVRKTVDTTEAGFQSLRQSVIDMGNELPSTREEIAAVMEMAGQLGIDNSSLTEFTRVIIDLGNATNLAGQEGATLLARFANITQMPQNQFRNLGSAITDLGNNFATTEAEIANMAIRIAAAGNTVGLTEADIMGMSAALSSVGVYAEMGGSAMSSTLLRMQESIQTGSKELEGFARLAGKSKEAFAQLFADDPMEAFTLFVEGVHSATAAGEGLATVMGSVGIREIRARQAISSMAEAGDLLRNSVDRSNKAFKDNIALTREASLRYSTTASMLKTARNQLTDVARQTGEALVPALRAALGMVGPLTDSFGGLIHTFTRLPSPLQATAGGMLAIAVASGPAMWAIGKLAGLYAPLVRGGLAVVNNLVYMRDAMASLAATRGVSTMAASMNVLKASIMSAGPLLALTAAVAALGAAYLLAKRNADQFNATHLTAADSADKLAKSLNIATTELKAFNDESSNTGAVVTEQQFAIDNKDVIASLNNIGTEQGKQGRLVQIAYRMRLEGASPEEVIEGISRLAKVAGVTIPVELTVENLDEFQNQVDAAARAAASVADQDMTPRSLSSSVAGWFGGDKGFKEAEAQLKNIGQAAADAYKVGNIEGFVSILGESSKSLDGNVFAVQSLAQSFGELSDVGGLSLQKMNTFTGALEELSSKSSTVPEQTKERIRGWLNETKALEGNARVQKIMDLAAQDGTWSMDEHGKAVKEAAEASKQGAGASGELADGMGEVASAADDLNAALEAMSGRIGLAQLDFDAGAAAAQAFADAIEKSTNVDARLGSGLTAGSAFKDLRKGLSGIDESSKGAADGIKSLADQSRAADPKMSGLQTRLEALAAAGDAYSKSIESSTMFDDQISSALSLGDAFNTFRKTFRRLPEELDMVALATGKLRPRAAEAVNNMLALGKAATGYLATLIEMGSTESEVEAQAARMRGEYSEMFQQMGLNESQINKYIEAMGLTPKQVTTAVKLSGVEAARFALDAYVQILGDNIPPEVATKVVADIQAGNIQAAADSLASFAASAASTARSARAAGAEVWELPKKFDPLKAALGEYSDAQQAALEAVMRFGDGVADYLSQVAHDGNVDEIRSQAYAIRDAFLEQLSAFGIVGDAAQEYLNLIGLSDWQIESAITLSGDADAMFRIQMYAQFLGEAIPPEVVTEVLALMDEGNLAQASERLAQWRTDEEQNQIFIKAGIKFDPATALTPSGVIFLEGMQQQGFTSISGHATGGRIFGEGTTTSDSNLRRLSRDEFVLKASSARTLGFDNLAQANATGRWPEAFNADPPGVNFGPLLARIDNLERVIANGGTNVSFGDINVVSPVESQTPSRIVSKIGGAMHRGGL